MCIRIMQVMKYGHYAIDTYRQCPRRFHFRYVDRLPIASSPQMAMGKHVHTALKALFQLPVHERNEVKLIDELRKAWKTDRKPFHGDKELEKQFGNRAVEMLTGFVEQYDLAIDPLMLEDFVEVPVGEHVI